MGLFLMLPSAGMPKRSYTDYSGYVAGRTVARRGADSRSVFNEARPVNRYAGPKRFRYNRFYQGRGVRTGSFMYRRFRGLPRATGLGIETKYFDTALQSNLPVPAATTAWTGNEMNPATVLCLNAPTQGTGASNREGRYITMESLQINGLVQISAQADQTAADVAPVIKLWVVLDRQTNGGTATGLDSENVYTNPAGTLLGGVTPLRNMLYSKRYKVLKEIELDLGQMMLSWDGTNMEQEGWHKCFDCFISLKGIKTEYFGNAGTVADITNNGLFVVGVVSTATVTAGLTYNARLRFRG